MSNEVEELQALQIAAAKTLGYSVKGVEGKWGPGYALFAPDGERLHGPSVEMEEEAFKLFLPKWGVSADANRELLEWLGANSDFMQHKWFQAELDKTYDERACKEAVAYLLASPLDVLRAFVAATREEGKTDGK